MTTETKLKKSFQIHLNQLWCKGCYLCLDVCPIEGIFFIENEVGEKGFQPVGLQNMDKCTGCQLCELLCPDLAIIIVNSE